MSVLTINGAAETEGAPDGHDCRTWVIACTDAFGRPYDMRITARRGSHPGVGVQSPTGEYGFVDANHVAELAYVLAEARRFLGVGVFTCTPNI